MGGKGSEKNLIDGGAAEGFLNGLGRYTVFCRIGSVGWEVRSLSRIVEFEASLASQLLESLFLAKTWPSVYHKQFL